MKRLLYTCALVVAATSTVAILASCDNTDDPVTPTTGSVSGTVTFQGTWPSTGQVQVSLFSAWPPAGPPDAFTDPITPSGTYNYSFNGLDPATYPAIVVGWLDPALPPGSEKILGMYWADEDSVAVDSNGNPQVLPTAVTVEAGDSKGSLDMAADLDVAP